MEPPESTLRETLKQLIMIRQLILEELATSEEKQESLNSAKKNSLLLEDEFFQRKAQKLAKKTSYTELHNYGYVSKEEVSDLDPWIEIYKDYLQRFKIKRSLESKGLWIKSVIEGEDEHLMLGRKDKPGEKIHLITDAGTGEIRIEANEKNRLPHDVVESIETTLVMTNGEKVKSTRSRLEFLTEQPKIENTPVLDIETSLGGKGGPDGHFVYFNVVNISNNVAIDVAWRIRGSNYNWDSVEKPFILNPLDKKRVEYRKDTETTHIALVNDLKFEIEYKNNEGIVFYTQRDLHQILTLGGVIYEFEIGEFYPAKEIK